VTYALLDDLILFIQIYLFVFNVFHIYYIHLIVLVLHVGVALPVAALVHIGLVPSLHKSAPTAQVMQTLPAVATGLPTSNCMPMGLTQQWVQQLRQLQPTCTRQG
jgi:hypothetical protein